MATPVIEHIVDPTETTKANHEERSLHETEQNNQQDDNTKDILDKIKLVNAGLKKPNRRQQINFNKAPAYTGGYTLNKEILEKLQQIIASGKLQPLIEMENYQESNTLNNDDMNAQRYSKSLPYAPNPMMGNQIGASIIPLPYMTQVPVIIMPSGNHLYNPGQDNTIINNNNNIKPGDFNELYQTRQGPPSFQFQWPLGQYFPVLIKDPLLAILQGGGWSNFFEYGQNADVCSRKQRSTDENAQNIPENKVEIDNSIPDPKTFGSREGRGLKKRNISQSLEDDLNTLKKVKKFFSKPSTSKPTKQQTSALEEPAQGTKVNAEDDGDLRFGTFTWLGDKKPVAPSPGFFINKLKVHRGGVAIAGPGGVATAGRGGTAIVGPGGLAYTQPGGLAVAGPAARVIALPSEANLSSVVSKLQALSATDGSVPRLLQAIPEGKVVATGPIIYYHPKNRS